MRLEPAERSTRVWAPPTGLGAACAPHVPTCAAGRGSRDARGAHPGSSASADVNGAAGRLQVWGSSRVPGPLRQRPQFSGFETRVRFWDRCGLHLARPGPPSCSRLRHRRLRVPPPEVQTSVPSRRPSPLDVRPLADGHHASLSRRVVCGQRVPESLQPPPARALWQDEVGNLPLRPHFLPNVPHERSRRGVLLIVAPQSWQHCLPRAPAPVTGGRGQRAPCPVGTSCRHWVDSPVAPSSFRLPLAPPVGPDPQAWRASVLRGDWYRAPRPPSGPQPGSSARPASS